MPLNAAGTPAKSYEEAKRRIEAYQALDDASIIPGAYTKFYDCGQRTKLAVVLLHGLTNHPGQYVQFAPLVRELGANVFVPRLPEQGDRDRMTTRLAKLTAEMLLAAATEAVDIACGLGERVCVLGISTSGLLCAFFAQYRADVAHSIVVSPAFALLRLAYWESRIVAGGMRALPNFFVWWDPRNKLKELPLTGYPRFSTHALGQCLRIGDDVHAASRCLPVASRATVVTNMRDPAVNNRAAAAVVEAWRKRDPKAIADYQFTDLPVNHDIIDPQNAVPRTDIVYPVLLQLVRSTMEVP